MLAMSEICRETALGGVDSLVLSKSVSSPAVERGLRLRFDHETRSSSARAVTPPNQHLLGKH
jgi:hypothetical protein